MNIKEQNKILDEYPYLDSTIKHDIVVLPETAKYYKSFPVVRGKRTQLAIDLISNDFIYEKYTKKLINATGITNSLSVFELKFGDTININTFTRLELFKVLEYLIKEDLFSPTKKELERFETLKQNISFQTFVEHTPDYSIMVDNISYTVSPKLILEFLSLPKDKRINLESFSNIPIKHMAYISTRFMMSNKVFDSYDVPENIKETVTTLRTYSEIDYEAINQYLNIYDPNNKQIKVNPLLESKILEGIPQNLTNLQTAIYIYMKMCEILTYDDEFYAVNQKGIVAFKHEQINHISEITPDKNTVVCYEFNAIYSHFLKQLGFKYEIVTNGYVNAFGGGHAYLTFRCDDYIIKVDSVTGVINGDIPRVKQKLSIDGIESLNQNKQTKEKFKKEVKEIEKLYYQIGKEPTFEETLHAYQNSTPNLMAVSFEEKMNIFFIKIQKNNYAPVDRLGYILNLKKILFTELERRNNIFISFIKNNHPIPNVEAESIVIITIKYDELSEKLYYTYNDRLGLSTIEKEELQERFNNGHYDYIDPKKPSLIPGIIKEEKKNVRRTNQNK